MDSQSDNGSPNIAAGVSASQLLQVGSSGPIYFQHPRSTGWPTEPPHMLPGGIGRLVGRHHLLQAMDDAMAPPGSLCCMLWGLAGSGKTTLALAWASSRIDQYPDGQFFVDMRAYSGTPRVEPRDAVRTFLATLGIKYSDLPENAAEWGSIFRSATAGKKCLVIVDNVGSYDDIKDLVPGLGSGLVVTSRRAIPEASIRHEAKVLKLPLLSVDEGVELLAERVGFIRVDRENASAERIVEILEGHPLALAIIGAKLAIHTSWRIQDAVDGIESEGTALRFLDDADLGIEVGRVISWSVEDLDVGPKRLLYAASMLPTNKWSAPVLSVVLGQTERDCDRTLRGLSLASLIDEIGFGSYNVHDIIKAYLSETRNEVLDPAEQLEIARRIRTVYLALTYAADRAIDPNRQPLELSEEAAGIADSVSFSMTDALVWLESATTPLGYLIDSAWTAGDFTFITRFAWSVNTFLYWRQDVAKSLAVQERAVDAAIAGDRAMEALSRRGLGRALADDGQLEQAAEQLLVSLELDMAGGDTTGLAPTQHAMAEVALRSGRYPEALRWGILATKQSRKNNNAVREARGLYDAARALAELGHYSWAKDLGLVSLSISEDHGNAYARALALHLLGTVGVKSGSLDEGCTWLERAWRVEESLGNARSVRAILLQLESAYVESGQEVAADEARRALSLLERYPDMSQATSAGGAASS